MNRIRKIPARWAAGRAWAAPILLVLLLLPPATGAASAPAGGPGGAIRLHGDRDRTPRRARDLWLDAASNQVPTDRPARGNDQAAASLLPDRSDRAARVPPGLAFLMSAAIPGTGQLAEGRNRAFAYLGTEAFAWIARFSWRDASRKKDMEAESFADRHWDYDQWYARAYDPDCQAIPPGQNSADLQEQILRQRDANRDAYYASLSKQDGYRAGWDDFSCDSPGLVSANRREYSGMRQDSNDFLAKARLATTLAFLNRIVSAVDAYRTARGARLALSPRTNLELDVHGSIDRPGAALRLRRRL